jgi:Zn-finger nucleic acid-binding protein
MSRSDAPIACPRCVNTKMLVQTRNGVPIHICMRCGANFFDAGELAHWEGWSWDVPSSLEGVSTQRNVSVLCPSCASRMDKHTFPIDPPLELERCSACGGILLDFEEIRHLPAVGKWAAARQLATQKAGKGARKPKGSA